MFCTFLIDYSRRDELLISKLMPKSMKTLKILGKKIPDQDLGRMGRHGLKSKEEKHHCQ